MFILLISFFQVGSCLFSKQLAHDLYLYTKVAVCDTSQIERWDCGYFCDRHPEMKDVKVFDSPEQKVLAYAGINTAEKRIVVSFRSTYNIQNFLNDLKFLKSDYPCMNCKVHTGFLESYKGISGPLCEYVRNLFKRNSKARLTVVGHSLGAAMATLAAIDLTLLGLHIHTFYIYGSPRVGNKEFAQYFDHIVDTENKARVTHFSDIVPHLPPKSLDYTHAVKEYWFNQDFRKYRDCKNGFEDETCSNSIWSSSVSDHRSYFNIRYRCNDDNYLQKTQNQIIL